MKAASAEKGITKRSYQDKMEQVCECFVGLIDHIEIRYGKLTFNHKGDGGCAH